jgi:hypothetical protein
MKPYPECNRDMPELRQKIGQLFASLPELESIELTHGGKRYRARRSEPWVTMDAKAQGRGWDCWTEWPLPEFYRRKAMGPNWQEKVAEEKRRQA